ncbi:DUF3320 domain-containing protein [Aquabacterium sp.]|uniref:DUF3320 domain-containing protein n=1 Tax=Aquabacterium sp. TaxID=1872578 RepID=UPI0024882181|nr:DUF3320 domain-containing protein [Aquabacterium sp.]MDI1349851.1 DUF3320 domain-containing protein [Aquabacterium sp.]
MLRIWSTDWWVDPNGTLERVCRQLDGLLEVSRVKRALEAEKEAAAVEAQAVIEKAKTEGADLADVTDSSVDTAAQRSEAAEQPSDDAPEDVYADLQAGTAPQTIESQRRQYIECDPAVAIDACDQDAFFSSSYDERLLAMIGHVVVTEGPVLDTVLARRISRAHGWQRTGSRIQERVEQLARQTYKTTEEDVGTFYWPESMQPGGEVVFRWPEQNAQRSFNEVCIEELMALAVIVDKPRLGKDEILVQMARELGVNQLRAASRGRLEVALRKAKGSDA